MRACSNAICTVGIETELVVGWCSYLLDKEPWKLGESLTSPDSDGMTSDITHLWTRRIKVSFRATPPQNHCKTWAWKLKMTWPLDQSFCTSTSGDTMSISWGNMSCSHPEWLLIGGDGGLLTTLAYLMGHPLFVRNQECFLHETIYANNYQFIHIGQAFRLVCIVE